MRDDQMIQMGEEIDTLVDELDHLRAVCKRAKKENEILRKIAHDLAAALSEIIECIPPDLHPNVGRAKETLDKTLLALK